jgi:hypothetical protein
LAEQFHGTLVGDVLYTYAGYSNNVIDRSIDAAVGAVQGVVEAGAIVVDGAGYGADWASGWRNGYEPTSGWGQYAATGGSSDEAIYNSMMFGGRGLMAMGSLGSSEIVIGVIQYADGGDDAAFSAHMGSVAGFNLLFAGSLRASAPGGDISLLVSDGTFAPEVGMLLRNALARANEIFANDPTLVMNYLTHAEGLRVGEYPGMTRLYYRKAVERLTAEILEEAAPGLLEYADGRSGPDFRAGGRIFDITTRGQVGAHLARPYGASLEYVTYEVPRTITVEY